MLDLTEYYTLDEVAKKLNTNTTHLTTLSQRKTAYLPIIMHENNAYVRKEVIDAVQNVFDIEVFNPIKGFVLTDAYTNFYLEQVSNSKKTYAITLATRISIYGEYKAESLQTRLHRFVKHCNKKLYGNNWRKKGLSITMYLVHENLYENPHFHGFVVLPDNCKHQRISIQATMQSMWSKIFKPGSVKLCELYDVKNWKRYFTKQLTNPIEWCGQERFNQSCERFIMVDGSG